MTREKAQEAVDAAFAAHIGQLFGILIRNIIGQEADASGKFSTGLAAADEAHSIASGVVDKTFGE